MFVARARQPNPKVRQAMQEEHTSAADSKDEFTTGNYEVCTTPEIEWGFVAEPECRAEWPEEEKLRSTPPG